MQIINSETGYTGWTFACCPPQLGQRARSSANICIRPFYPLPTNQQRWSWCFLGKHALWPIMTHLGLFSHEDPKHSRPSLSRDVSISAVIPARCYCRPLSSNPLLQFPESQLHLSLRFPALALGMLRHWFTQMDEFTPTKSFKVQYPDVSVSRVYLGDSNPADTGVQWGSHSQSWGPTTAEIARPCRQKPCRSEAGEVTSRGGGGSWPAPSLLEARRSSPAAGGRCSWSSTSSALWAAWRGRSFATNSAPFLETRGRLWVKIPHTATEFGFGNQVRNWNGFFSGSLFLLGLIRMSKRQAGFQFNSEKCFVFWWNAVGNNFSSYPVDCHKMSL